MASTDTPTSASHRLADVLLTKQDGPLERFVRTRRKADVSWRRIALDLRDAVAVELAPETLRSWFPDEPTEASA